jgi:hypothetical protein
MKCIHLLSITLFMLLLSSCETIQKATNSTGSAFTLTGEWEMVSNNPENVLIGSIITVVPFIAEARITRLSGMGNCLRQEDVLWKGIVSDGSGGFTISNLVTGCNGLNYQAATIYVINNDQIRVTGKNIFAQDITQLWKRIK